MYVWFLGGFMTGFFSSFTGDFWDGLGTQLNKSEIENIKILRKRVYLVLDKINRKIKFGLSHFELSNSPFLGGNFLVEAHIKYTEYINSRLGVYIAN